MRVGGKAALVTGAASGIGAATARRLAQEGALVYATDIRVDAIPPDMFLHVGELDTTKPDAWLAMAERIGRDHGRFDILVNNVGNAQRKPFKDITLEEWRTVVTRNLDSTFLGCQTFQALLASAGDRNPRGAAIVNISSIAALIGFSECASYCAAKGAVASLTKALVAEFASEGMNVRVNSVHPGPIRTPAFERNAAAHDASGSEAARAPKAFGRIGTPEDVANACLFLASDEAGHITGVELPVDGGMLSTLALS